MRRSVLNSWTSLQRIPSVRPTLARVCVRPEANVQYKRTDEREKVSWAYCKFGTNMHYRPDFFAPDTRNERLALEARVLKKTPEVDEDEMRQFVEFFKQNIDKLVPRKRVNPVKFKDYIERTNASSAVKKALIAAKARLNERGQTIHSKLSTRELYQLTTRKSFVKTEFTLRRTLAGHEPKAPRLIQGAQPEFTCLVGPFIMALQRHVESWMVPGAPACFTSGHKPSDILRYCGVGHRRTLENDVSGWDVSYSEALCELEVWWVKRMGAPRAVVDLMRRNINTHGYTSKGHKYAVPGTRKSGDPYTSVFNSVMNAMLHFYVYCQEVHVGFAEAATQLNMLVQGDDNLLFHDGDELGWHARLLKLGFETVSKYRDCPQDAEFCSQRLLKTKRGWTLVPKLGRVLTKFGCFLNPPTNIHSDVVMRGVCLGFKQYGQMPVLRELAKVMGDGPAYVIDEPWKMLGDHVEADEYTWAALAQWYRLTPSEVMLVEEEIRKKNFQAPVLTFMLDRDTDATPFY